MQISEDDVRRLERLAALRLDAEERSRMRGHLERILEYVRQLQKLDVSDVPPTVHAIEIRHLLRPDVVQPSLPAEEMLRNAPDTRGGFYSVPRFVLGSGGGGEGRDAQAGRDSESIRGTEGNRDAEGRDDSRGRRDAGSDAEKGGGSGSARRVTEGRDGGVRPDAGARRDTGVRPDAGLQPAPTRPVGADPALWSVAEQSERLRSGELSPADLVDACLAGIERLDPELHCMTQVFAEEARRRARALESSRERGPLWGIPWVAKDILATRSGRTTCGSRLLENFHSPYDATAVERLEAAGAILLGKTNMDEFAMGSSTENSAWGPTRNPWDLERVPGGSSGGSAAAVAADLAGFALGTDTGGSIRQPAGFCGVVGLKPTYGRVSRYGLVAFASSLDQIGPIAKTTRDAATVLQVIGGHDPRDATSLDRALPPLDVGLKTAPRGLRVGVPRGFVQAGVEPAVREDFEHVLETMRAAGAVIVDVEIPHAPYAIAIYYIVATAEASSNLARYDGVRYTRREPGARDLASLYEVTRTHGFGDEVKRRILLGTFVLSSGYYDAYYLRAERVRTLLRRDFDAAFAVCDVLAIPTSPSLPFRFGERMEDPLQMYLSDVFTVPANLAGLPGISLPTRVVDGLPLAVQLFAPALEEPRLLRAASWLESLLRFGRLSRRISSAVR